MPKLMEFPPDTPAERVTDILHGVPVTDPYRWLEDQESPRTREWLAGQVRYARSYLDSMPDRERIRERVRELLDVETYDSIQRVGDRYFFRKRLPGQEQPGIFFREGSDGEDQPLVNPTERGSGKYTAVKLLRVSPDGQLLLYEVKDGGERTGTFELLDLRSRTTLSDVLPRGYLRGFAFAPNCQSFYYVHEVVGAKDPHHHVVYHHVLGTSFNDDHEVFVAAENDPLRLHILQNEGQLGFLVIRFLDKTYTDFYLWPFDSKRSAEPVIRNAEYKFGPLLLKDGRILAVTDRESPNLRIVEVHPRGGLEAEFADLIPAGDSCIQHWIATGERIFVSYIRELKTTIDIFDSSGRRLGQLPTEEWDTVRLMGVSEDGEELFFERESFTKPIQICRYSPVRGQIVLWADRKMSIDPQDISHTEIWFTAKDGTRIPMFLVGRRDILEGGPHPTIMTSYGGYGVSMTPQFSVFVAFLIERGCLFALPNIRGGSEFGVKWHNAAKRRDRQVAFDDFLCAAEWLIETGRTEPQRLAIFGGSNSGLLVGAALTQRPELFRAIVCMVPLLDMLRYHLFDNAHVWKDEFGTADDPEDFKVLAAYSPYHQVRDGVAYPATMIVSGDADQNCNPLHARKMAARLQAANVSDFPILLDYTPFRGHSPVLPLSERIEGLTDRLAFLCDQLELPV
jgi:prolyl oligopeptidase